MNRRLGTQDHVLPAFPPSLGGQTYQDTVRTSCSVSSWGAQASVLTSSLEESPLEQGMFWGVCLPTYMLSPRQIVLFLFPI